MTTEHNDDHMMHDLLARAAWPDAAPDLRARILHAVDVGAGETLPPAFMVAPFGMPHARFIFATLVFMVFAGGVAAGGLTHIDTVGTTTTTNNLYFGGSGSVIAAQLLQ